jgi:exodeoxyribonuclease VII large subunit
LRSSLSFSLSGQAFSESGKVDVVICGRGGGSLEDLWCFNEEIVVRAIFAIRVPVISAVGHEVDMTLSDLVADLRVATPTAAAEMVVPSRLELSRSIKEIKRRLLDHSRWLMSKYQEFDELSSRLEDSKLVYFSKRQQSLELLQTKPDSLNPKAVLGRGFSIVRKGNASVTSAKQLIKGDGLSLEFNDGSVETIVK